MRDDGHGGRIELPCLMAAFLALPVLMCLPMLVGAVLGSSLGTRCLPELTPLPPLTPH